MIVLPSSFQKISTPGASENEFVLEKAEELSKYLIKLAEVEKEVEREKEIEKEKEKSKRGDKWEKGEKGGSSKGSKKSSSTSGPASGPIYSEKEITLFGSEVLSPFTPTSTSSPSSSASAKLKKVSKRARKSTMKHSQLHSNRERGLTVSDHAATASDSTPSSCLSSSPSSSTSTATLSSSSLSTSEKTLEEVFLLNCPVAKAEAGQIVTVSLQESYTAFEKRVC